MRFPEQVCYDGGMKVAHFALLVLFLAGSAPAAFAAGDFGVVMAVSGEAVIGVKPVKVGDKVDENDVVTTGKRSYVRILLREGVAMQVGSESTMRIARREGEPTTVDLLKGFVLSRVKKSDPAAARDKFRVRTASASLGVRGTTFFTKEELDGRTFLCVCEGTVSARWTKGDRKITATHHDKPVWLRAGKAEAEPAPMGMDHDDEQIAELDKLLR